MKIKTEQPTFLSSVTITLTADDFKNKEVTNVTHDRITDIGRSLVNAKKDAERIFHELSSHTIDFHVVEDD